MIRGSSSVTFSYSLRARLLPLLLRRHHKRSFIFFADNFNGFPRLNRTSTVKGMAFNKGMSLKPQEARDDADDLQLAVKEITRDNHG